MGAINQAFEHIERIDFRAVSKAALTTLPSLVQGWLPHGKRRSDEWVATNPTRNDKTSGSFSVNLKTGVWSDFATGDAGGDAIDLLAYLKRMSKLDAARELGHLLGVTSGDVISPPLAPVLPAKTVAPVLNLSLSPAAFPSRTTPDKDGKPRFVVAGDEGPRIRDDEKRRHVYCVDGTPVRIKIMRKDGNAMNVYRVVDADGATGWQYRKPEGFAAVPYFSGTNPFDADPERPLHWPEGEKDVETLTTLGLPAFTFGGCGDGLPAGCEKYLVGRHVVILADNDEEGRKHADRKAALALPVATSVRVVHFADLPKKGDVSDYIASGATVDDLKARLASALELKSETEMEAKNDAAPAAKPTDDMSKLPLGYRFKADGLYWSDPNDEEKPEIKLSGSFEIVAETRDGDGSNWGVLLQWVDRDGRDHRFALPRALLAGDGSDARRALLSDGLYVAPGQKARQQFNAFLLQVRSSARARATQRIGWHGNAFVLADESFGGSESDRLLLQTVTAHEHTFRQAGTLESWQQNVARYAPGNSRLVLAISAAFAGPLIGPCGAEGGGVHFRGASSTGKSTALHVAGSVWGGGKVTGFVRSWRATSNGLEGVALGHCDTLLCLDELSQLQARDAGEAAYMLGNGSGKARSARDGSARRAASWRVMFLSSGEISLADKIAEDGRARKLAAGQQVRIIDLPADAGAEMGMFERLHDFSTPEALARHLREATQQHYGVAARTYLSAVVPQIADLQGHVSKITKAFCEAYVPVGADGQVERVAQRFALIAAGGELATRAKILPWQPGEAVAASGRCFEDWVAQRGGCEPAEERQGIEQVRAFLLANGMARFIPAWEEDADKRIPIRDVAGYRQKTGDGWEYFVTSPAWKEICAGLDARRLASVLVARGFISAADGPHHSKVIRVPGHGRLRLYHVNSTFLEGDGNA